MRNPYVQVLQTYLRRPFKSWIAAIWTIVPLVLIVASLATSLAMPRKATTAVAPLLPMGAVFLGALMWLHFREQMVSARRRLCPGFALPHVMVFAGLLSLLMIGWPASLVLLGGARSFGMMAVCAVIMAWLGWFFLTMSFPVLVPGVVGWIWLFTPDATSRLSPLAEGRHETAAMGMIAVALAVIVVTIWRMVGLTEEDRFYHRGRQSGTSGLRARMTGDVNRSWAEAQKHRLFGWPRAGSRVYIPTGTSLWDRARHWRSTTRGTLLFMLVMAAATIFSVRLTSRQQSTTPMALFWVIFMPVMSIAHLWLRQWRFLEVDSLRPIERAPFLKEIGLAISVQVVQAWGAFAAVVIVDTLLFGRRPIDLRSLAMSLAGTLALLVLALGTALSVMRYRSLVMLLVCILPILPPGVAIMTTSEPRFAAYQNYALLGAIIAGGIGFLVARNAYRKWLNTELG